VGEEGEAGEMSQLNFEYWAKKLESFRGGQMGESVVKAEMPRDFAEVRLFTGEINVRVFPSVLPDTIEPGGAERSLAFKFMDEAEVRQAIICGTWMVIYPPEKK
jgi:hypothetical protein